MYVPWGCLKTRRTPVVHEDTEAATGSQFVEEILIPKTIHGWYLRSQYDRSCRT
jgi:hypothetical protein